MRTPVPSASSLGISQDNIIFGMVILAFIIYISMKGELKTYLGFFTPAASGSSASSAGVTSSSGIPGTPGLSSNWFAGLPSSWSDFFSGYGTTPPAGSTISKPDSQGNEYITPQQPLFPNFMSWFWGTQTSKTPTSQSSGVGWGGGGAM